MPSCNTYRLTWVSYVGRGVSLHGCSSKLQPLLLTLDEGYLLTATPSDLECGIAPLGPPGPGQPLLLGGGVAPPGRHPKPQAWGRSSRPLPLASGVGLVLPAATPGLRRGVGPPGRGPWPRAWGSSSWPFLYRRSLALSTAAPTSDVG